MNTLWPAGLLAGALALAAGVAADIPRTAAGRPDFSGTYDIATLTPLERPEQLGDKLHLTAEEAQRVGAEMQRLKAADLEPSDPDREAPPVGGDGSTGAAGNVGGYNAFWIDNGEGAFMIDGKYRTSIIIEPKNGRQPPMTPAAQKAALKWREFWRPNTGEAWWLDEPGPGPFDDPELRPTGERCLLGFGSTAGPPMLPVLYNNVKRIVQNEDTVVILNEMNHDARVVRMNAEHAPEQMRFWLGDSIGWWEGDVLVIDTTNFRDEPALWGATRDLHVVERFEYNDAGELIYTFTVEDPSVWTAPWSGQYPWPRTDAQLFEYACHEGNYALGGVLRGARLLEAEALAKRRDAADTPSASGMR